MQDGPCNCKLRIIVIPIQIFALHSCKSKKYNYDNRTQRKKQISLQSPESIASYFMEKMRHERKEQLMLAMFDSKGMLLGERLLSVGTSNAALISAKDIYRAALQEQAVYIVILHNHPSGNPEPSREDILITRKIRECGELLDSLLMDHIIIGDNEYFSFCEQDILYEKGRE